MESLLLKVLDFRLQIATGPRQIEETGFVFIHVIVILYSAESWHELMLFLLVVGTTTLECPNFEKSYLKNCFHELQRTIKNSKFRSYLYHQNAHFMLYTCRERYFKFVLYKKIYLATNGKGSFFSNFKKIITGE